MNPDIVSAVANVVTASAALVAIVIAVRQLHSSREVQKEATAKELYKDYLLLAFQNPNYSSPSYPIASPTYPSLKTDKETFEQYEFYVSNMLFAIEEIHRLTDGDDWTEVLTDQIKYHALYLKENRIKESDSYKKTIDLIKKAINDYDSEANAETLNS
jgi:hypothetical protein